MQLSPENTREGYSALWQKMQIRPEKKVFLDGQAQRVAAGMAQYEEVERETGVPWWFVGIIHLRESNLDFKTFLGNGEPLDRVTRLVPKGLGPWKSWKDGAVEALKREGLDKVKVWDIPTALFYFEKFNGFGYVSKGINSPYVWAASSHYSRGKFVSDGQYSPSTIDSQPGCAPMLAQMILLNLIPELLKKVVPMTANAPTWSTEVTPSPTVSIPATASNVVINPLINNLLYLFGIVGSLFTASGVDTSSILATATHGNFWLGLVATTGAAVLNHVLVKDSNKATLATYGQPANPIQTAA
jgi:lysozyme family protein